LGPDTEFSRCLQALAADLDWGPPCRLAPINQNRHRPNIKKLLALFSLELLIFLPLEILARKLFNLFLRTAPPVFF
jgi:hypothetical protein